MAEEFGLLDHILVMHSQHKTVRGPKSFKFELYSLERKELIPLMEGWWNKCLATGNPGFIIAKKLDYLKGKLKTWATDNLGKLEARIKWWESTIADLKGVEETTGLTEEGQLERREAEQKLNEAIKDECGVKRVMLVLNPSTRLSTQDK